jgi:hypothetical protein
MEEKFIPDTQKRYSITSDGVIYSHYKYTNTGKKFYKIQVMAKHITKNSVIINLQYGKQTKTNRSKVVYVNTLMKDVFKLKKPDTFHMYNLVHKNGNMLDSSLNNLEWRIRCLSDVNFYPQPYYDRKGNITSKCCSNCGEIKEISNYCLQTNKSENKYVTYKNKCTRCRTMERRILINSSEELLKRSREHSRRFANSEKGKAYHREYEKNWYNKNSDMISDHYISENLRIKVKDITPEIREIYKKRITLKRKLKNHGKEN